MYNCTSTEPIQQNSVNDVAVRKSSVGRVFWSNHLRFWFPHFEMVVVLLDDCVQTHHLCLSRLCVVWHTWCVDMCFLRIHRESKMELAGRQLLWLEVGKLDDLEEGIISTGTFSLTDLTTSSRVLRNISMASRHPIPAQKGFYENKTIRRIHERSPCVNVKK